MNAAFRFGSDRIGVLSNGARLLFGGVLRAAYPPTCLLCGGAGVGELDLCAGCLRDLPDIRPACGRCAMPLAVGSPAGALCGACQRKLPPFDRAIALFRYQDQVRELVGALKFRGHLNRARLFGQLLADALRKPVDESLPDLILPVPLHRSRLRERGFNQALEIARVVGRSLHIDVDARAAVRLIARPPQVSLAREERLTNVRGVFGLRRPLSATRVAIVDDVVTTGATVSELARVLRRHGAEWVEVWAIARTP